MQKESIIKKNITRGKNLQKKAKLKRNFSLVYKKKLAENIDRKKRLLFEEMQKFPTVDIKNAIFQVEKKMKQRRKKLSNRERKNEKRKTIFNYLAKNNQTIPVFPSFKNFPKNVSNKKNLLNRVLNISFCNYTISSYV